jgi:NAD(P)-dependent dehydrogenase (short-subunit alcohol dehydrogenase family)
MQQTRTYIITGGNTGLGYQCARFLGANPKNLIVIAGRDKAKGADAAGQLRQAGCAVKLLHLDRPNVDLR